MHIVEYSASDRLTQPLMGPSTRRSNLRSIEEAKGEIEGLLHDCVAKGYNEEGDYYWGRYRAGGRRILKIEGL